MNFGAKYLAAKDLLAHKIATEGAILSQDIILVDRFLNQELDIELIEMIGDAFAEVFADYQVDKVLTLEASGIPLAFTTAKALSCKALFAKKSRPLNMDGKIYESEVYSYTRQKYYPITLSRHLLSPGDRVLLVDDFLARGAAMQGLIRMIKQANAQVVGVAVAIEKSFQEGSHAIKDQHYPLCSLLNYNSLTVK